MHKGLDPQAGELDFTVTFKIRYVLPFSKTACWISYSDLKDISIFNCCHCVNLIYYAVMDLDAISKYR